MRRDADLVREILLAIEAADMDENAVPDGLSGCGAMMLSCHLDLLTEAGLVRRIVEDNHIEPAWLAYRLTWAGHDYLDPIRDPIVWRRARSLGARAGGWTLATIAAITRGVLLAKVRSLGIAVHP